MAKKSDYWSTVTPFSKLIAMILFISLPFLGFVMGMRYQSLVDQSQSAIVKISNACPAGYKCIRK